LHANIISKSDSVFRTNPEADSTEVMFNQFVLGVQTWQKGIDDEFSRRLLNAALGRLDLHLGQKQLKVWETYLVDSLIYPENPEWMGLFLEVHSGVSSNPYVSKGEVIAALKTGDFKALKTSLDTYPMTRTLSEKQLLMVSFSERGMVPRCFFSLRCAQDSRFPMSS